MIYQPPSIQYRGFFDPVLQRLLVQQVQLSPISSPQVGRDWRAERLRHFIDTEHGKVGWSLDHLCKQLNLGVSGSHGARLFKKHIGVGIREYTTRKRLVVAAEKLKNTTVSVKEVAADLGYKNQTDFWRQFKQLFSLNPTEFRIAHRQAASQNAHCPDQQSAGFPQRSHTGGHERHLAES